MVYMEQRVPENEKISGNLKKLNPVESSSKNGLKKNKKRRIFHRLIATQTLLKSVTFVILHEHPRECGDNVAYH